MIMRVSILYDGTAYYHSTQVFLYGDPNPGKIRDTLSYLYAHDSSSSDSTGLRFSIIATSGTRGLDCHEVPCYCREVPWYGGSVPADHERQLVVCMY